MSEDQPASRRRWLAIIALRRVPFWTATRSRRVARVGVLALYILFGSLIMLVALQNRLLFPGAWLDRSWIEPEAGVRDVELVDAGGTRLHAWWTEPAGWTPRDGAVLLAHGNGNNLSKCGPSLTAWRQALGRAVMVFDYPGYGKCEGSPSEEGCYRASDAAWRWLTAEKKVAAKEIILVGFSLGGAIAVDLASRRECRALIILNSFTSFADMAQSKVPLLPVRWFVRIGLHSEAKIGGVSVPVFVSHGTADDTVPFVQGERLYAAAREPKRFHRRDGEGHWEPLGPGFFAEVRDFLARHPPGEKGERACR